MLDFGLSRLTSLQFILCDVAGFYKLTIPQSLPSHLRDYSTCNNARLEFSTIFISSFDPNEWCLKNGRHSGGLNPGPLNHYTTARVVFERKRTESTYLYFDCGYKPLQINRLFAFVIVVWLYLFLQLFIYTFFTARLSTKNVFQNKQEEEKN